MDLNLTGRVAVVTGAATGIGEAIARTLAAEGCDVAILDRDAGLAAKTAVSLTERKFKAHSVAVDVADAAAVAKAITEIGARHDRLDILVNAAGVLSTGTFADLPEGEWQRVCRVNVDGVLHCAKSAIPFMARQRYGRIVNIASVAAMRGGGSIGNTLYGASKAAVVALTMGLAREFGRHGITVNAIAPSVAETAMTQAALTEEARQKILARIPLGRLASPADIADLTAFLVSARANFITGAVVPVDGGILTT